jgi:hypothetical protein
MRLLRKCVISLEMTRTEDLNAESFIRTIPTMMMNGMMISIMEILLLMMLLLCQQNYRLPHGRHHTSHPSSPCMMGTQIRSSFWWATKQPYLHMGAILQSWWNPSSWQSRMLHKPSTPLFGQEQSHHGRSWRTCWSPVSKGSKRSQLLQLCSSAHKTTKNTSRRMYVGSCVWEHKRPQCPMKSSLRPWSKGFGQDLRLNTSPGNPLKPWRSCFRRWMSTSGPIMISAREGKKLIGFLRWLGASEEDSTLGMSDQSTIPLRVMTKEASFRGHNIVHNLQGNNKALLGHQLQGAEAAGASEEDMGINPGNSIAYSVVKTRVTLQEHARSPFRSKKRLLKQKRGRINRSRFYILLRATLHTYQNTWVINLQLLLLRQVIHKLLALGSHCHHYCHLLIPEASSQKGTNTPNSSVTSGRSP